MFLRSHLFLLNKDDTSGGGAGSKKDDDKPADTPKGDSEPELKRQLDELQRKHDSAFKELRTANEKAENLQAELDKINKQKVIDSGNVEEIKKSFAADLEKVTGERDTLRAQLKNGKKRDAFYDVAPEIFVEKSLGQVFELIKDKLDVVGEGDEVRVEVKGSHKSLKDWLKGYADENDHFAKNLASGGSGAKGGGGKETVQKATSIPNDFASWPKDKKKEWMRANPELAATAASRALGGG